MSTILPHSDLNTLHDRLSQEIHGGASVLDIGAGLAKYHQLLVDKGCSLTLVDAHEAYLTERKQRFPQAELIHAPAWAALWDFANTDRRWDFVLGIDFLEHLDPDDAQKIAEMMKRVASKMILFVPEGNHPQDSDGYNLGGDYWQTHRSTWYAEGLEALGFTVERWVDFHRWAIEKGCDPGALWATWTKK